MGLPKRRPAKTGGRRRRRRRRRGQKRRRRRQERSGSDQILIPSRRPGLREKRRPGPRARLTRNLRIWGAKKPRKRPQALPLQAATTKRLRRQNKRRRTRRNTRGKRRPRRKRRARTNGKRRSPVPVALRQGEDRRVRIQMSQAKKARRRRKRSDDQTAEHAAQFSAIRQPAAC